jgi:hypothetical protein
MGSDRLHRLLHAGIECPEEHVEESDADVGIAEL